MWCARYFCRRYFAARYWPKIGVTVVFNAQWAMGSNQLIGPIAPQPVLR